MTQVMSIAKKIAEDELEPAIQLDELEATKADDYYAACAGRLYAKAKNPVNSRLTQRAILSGRRGEKDSQWASTNNPIE